MSTLSCRGPSLKFCSDTVKELRGVESINLLIYPDTKKQHFLHNKTQKWNEVTMNWLFIMLMQEIDISNYTSFQDKVQLSEWYILYHILWSNWIEYRLQNIWSGYYITFLMSNCLIQHWAFVNHDKHQHAAFSSRLPHFTFFYYYKPLLSLSLIKSTPTSGSYPIISRNGCKITKKIK